MLKSVHGALLRVGIDARRPFAKALATNSRRLLERRLRSSPHQILLESEDLTHHYADVDVTQDAIRNVLLSFIAARVSFIEQHLGSKEIARSSFLDIGDSDGIFLRLLGRRGVSVNSAARAVTGIAARGLTAVQGDATHLAFRDDACDYVLCFETLEHLANPLGGLRELYRVCRRGAFISVPHVSRTTVYPANWCDFPQDMLHIFELSPTHWNALLSHTPFRIETAEVIPVVEGARGLRELLAFGAWRALFGSDRMTGTFTGFLAYYLSKPSRRA